MTVWFLPTLVFLVLTSCGGDREPVPTDQLSWCGALRELVGRDVEPERLASVRERLADPPAEIAQQWEQIQRGTSASNSPAFQRVAGYVADECGRDIVDLAPAPTLP